MCRDHLQLGQELDCIDFDTAAEVSGSKFVYLKRAAALLELALVNYAMQKVVSRGFVPMMTPDLVKESVLEKCGFQPRGTATQVCLEGVSMVELYAGCLVHADLNNCTASDIMQAVVGSLPTPSSLYGCICISARALVKTSQRI